MDTQVDKNATDIYNIKTSVSTLDKNAVKYDDDTKGTISLKGKDGTTITNVKDGAVNESSTDAVNGKQLYTEQKAREDADAAINKKIGSLDQDGNYIRKDASISNNLRTLDTHVKQNADAISQETKDREAADKAINDKIGSLDKDGKYIQKDTSISTNLSMLDTQVDKNATDISNMKTSISTLDKDAVKYDDDTKGTISLKGKDGTTITNVKDGSVAENSKDAVNGGQLYKVDQKVENNTTEINNIKNGNFTDASKKAIHNIAKDAVEVVAGTNTQVDTIEGTDTAPTQYKVNVVGNGEVKSGNEGLISGKTAYSELRPTDGSYVKQSNTTAVNLSSLDTGLKTTSDLIHTNAKGDTIQIGGNSTATKIDVSGKDKDGKSMGRVITGIVSDANDPNSAANVGYVNGITEANSEQIYRDMNMQYNHVENDISRAAAGSNALAALHPMQEFDPDDKAQFALGYGHYRNANAGAVGAFYQPDENSMVNFGVSFGNGDAGINAGVTFKFGPGGSSHHALTKTQMAKVIDAQSKEIDELKKDNADKDKRIDALEQKMTEILAKLDKSKD